MVLDPQCLYCLVTSGGAAATVPHLVPVAVRVTVRAAAGTAVVDASVVLTRRRSAARAERPVAHHVRPDTLLRTGELVSARPPSAAWTSAVDPILLFDLIGAATIRVDIPDTTNVRVAVRLHLTYTLHTSVGEGAATTSARALRR